MSRFTERRAARGQSLTELALLTPVLALLLIGVVDLGRAFFFAVRLEDAVKEGALYGILHPLQTNGSDPNSIKYHTKFESPVYLNLQDSNITVTCYGSDGVTTKLCPESGGTLSGNDQIRVTAYYDFRPMTVQLVGITGATLRLTRSAQMAVIK